MTTSPFGRALSAAGIEFQAGPLPAEGSPDVAVVKCLVLKDKKKATHCVVIQSDKFGGPKKLSQDLGLKELRFLSRADIEAAGEVLEFCTPAVLSTVDVDQIHVHDVIAAPKCAVVALSETEAVSLSAENFTAFLQSFGKPLTNFKVVESGAVTGASGSSKPTAKPMQKSVDTVATKAISKVDVDKALIGLTVTKAGAFAEWYTQLITKAELIEYYDVSGCYILRPWAFEIWEYVQSFLDTEFKKRGTKNCYFPTFVTKAKLETEESHISGFAAEVAWVTKSGQADLAEPIAIRPTSETIMYPAYAKWIRSHRDLPVVLNQWCSVVRWEFKQPTPFIRTREFLWQEGHTAHATKEEAIEKTVDMAKVYADCYEHILAVPVVPGRKSETEKFAGGDMSYTVECFIPQNGRGLQGATSHFLGQNFAKMFHIEFLDENKESKLVWQTSWGFTTRSIGAMIMIHGDDKGLVLPPRAAPIQIVIVPIIHKDDDSAALKSRCHDLAAQLRGGNLRVEVDDRDQYNPGWKYNHWELKGVPLRIEIGRRELLRGDARVVLRYNGEAEQLEVTADFTKRVSTMLDSAHTAMLETARAVMKSRIKEVKSFDEVMEQLNSRNLILTPWCGQEACEEAAKKETGRLSDELQAESGMAGAMKTLCIPQDQPKLKQGTQCFRGCGPATCYVLWGRSY